jgi:hypothetical protein
LTVARLFRAKDAEHAKKTKPGLLCAFCALARFFVFASAEGEKSGQTDEGARGKVPERLEIVPVTEWEGKLRWRGED